MPRTMTGAMTTALAAETVRLCRLVEFQLSTPVYFTDAPTTLSWNGQSWAPAHLMTISAITESMGLQLSRTTVSFSGVDQSGIATVLQYEYLNRRAIVRLAVLTESLTVVASPLTLVAGRLDKPVITTDPDSGTCLVSLDIVTRETPLGRVRTRFTNPASQALHFTGDKGFDNVSEETTTLVWGGKGHLSRAQLTANLRPLKDKLPWGGG